MTTTKEVFYVGTVTKESYDSYANITWPIGKEVRVSEEVKKRGFIGKTAGHGIHLTLNLKNVVFHTKETVVRTEETKVVNI